MRRKICKFSKTSDNLRRSRKSLLSVSIDELLKRVDAVKRIMFNVVVVVKKPPIPIFSIQMKRADAARKSDEERRKSNAANSANNSTNSTTNISTTTNTTTTTKTTTDTSLWVDKYAPKTFLELLSDEVLFIIIIAKI